MNPLYSTKRQTTLVFLVTLVCFGLLPKTQAVSPAPDGGYPGGNTAEGQAALLSLTTGGFNTAVGFLALRSDTAGAFNTAVGSGTLLANTADENTATGAGALLSNTTGSGNTANGALALFFNTTGINNTAIGADALENNTIGNVNTAIGAGALVTNTTGSFNEANGFNALSANTTGFDNTANGNQALSSNTVGIANTANGFNALANNTTGNGNVALGLFAGLQQTTGSNNVYIGAQIEGVAGESNACYIASIFGQTSASGIPVLINSNNQLGTATSSKRFKEDIKPIDKTSEALFALKPVSFHYKKEIDPARLPQLGLVAEDVEKVNPDLVVRDKEGKPYTVRYDQVNAMLLNEFLKEHQKVQDLEKQVEKLTAGLQKVSAQFELSKTARQTALNNQ